MQAIRSVLILFLTGLLLSPITSGCRTKSKLQTSTPEPKKGYHVTLKMDGMDDSMVIMGNYWADRSVAFDTGYYNKRKKQWVFEGDEQAPRGIYFLIFEDRTMMEFLMNENQEFTILGDTVDDYTANLRFEGSDENNRYADYKRKSMFYGKKIIALNAEIKALQPGDAQNKKIAERKTVFGERIAFMKGFIKDNPNDIFTSFITAIKPIDVPKLKKENGTTDTMGQYHFYKDHYWDNFNFKEDALVRTPEKMIFNKINGYFMNVLPQHPDTAILHAEALLEKTKGYKELDKYFIFRITQIYDTISLMCMDRVFVHMVDKYYLSDRAYWIDSATRERMRTAADKKRYSACGAKALDLNFYDFDSVPHRLYDNMGSKFTIIAFYDPTCGHCKKEMPILHELYSRKKNEGLKVYAISAMNKKKEWKKYILEDNPTWTDWRNVCDIVPYRIWVDNREKYNIYANPTLIILNSKGEVIAKKIPAKNIEPFLEQYEKLQNKP